MAWTIIGGPENVTYPPSTSSRQLAIPTPNPRLTRRPQPSRSPTSRQTPRCSLNSATPSNPADEPSCSTASGRGPATLADLGRQPRHPPSRRLTRASARRGRRPLRGIQPPEPCLARRPRWLCLAPQCARWANSLRFSIARRNRRFAGEDRKELLCDRSQLFTNTSSSSSMTESAGDVVFDVSEG